MQLPLEKNEQSLLNFYIQHTKEVLIPFWRRAVDRKHGGVFTCFDNSGSKLISKNKFTWSQGRFLWIWSRIARQSAENNLFGPPVSYYEDLHKTVSFLEEHVFLDNGNCSFLLSESGEKLEIKAGEGFDISFYADCFVVMGLTEYSRLFKDQNRLEKAVDLFFRIEKRLKTGEVRSEPYPIPSGFKAFAVPMILLNVVQELADVAEMLHHNKQQELFEASLYYMNLVIDHFCLDSYRIAEMYSEESSDHQTLLGRHFNPGHTIEAMWFVMHTALTSGDQANIIKKASKVIEKAFQIGWDSQYGGLLHYVDKHGGKPYGKRGDSAYERSIETSWDTKLWWVHSEALYSTRLSYKLTGSQEMKLLYDKVHSYTFSTFPNPEEQIGEWIQIRNRKGKPLNQVVALPVKDPFHILRNLLLLIGLESKAKS